MKHVTFDISVRETTMKRICECQTCSNYNNKLKITKQQYCEILGEHKCVECKEWRCDGCMFLITKCKNCLRK